MEYIITMERRELAAETLQAFPSPTAAMYVGVVRYQIDGHVVHETRPQHNRLNALEEANSWSSWRPVSSVCPRRRGARLTDTGLLAATWGAEGAIVINVYAKIRLTARDHSS